MHDARAIANLLIREMTSRHLRVTNLKLQKLLYLTHSFFLVTYRRPLIDSQFEAWQYGPVHRGVYDAFRKFGGTPITEEAQRFNPVTGVKSTLSAPVDVDVRDVITKVVGSYGGWSASELVELTHAKDGPWDIVVQSAKREANLGLKIDDQLIAERFKYHWFGKKSQIPIGEDDDERPLVA